MAARGRGDVDCAGPHTVADEIVDGAYVAALAALGADVRVVDAIPSTPFTKDIPGGRQIFWGMALNKLRVFNMTEFSKLLWMDADTLVLKNVDHLLKKRMFTAAFTVDCCNANSPAKPSGGLWVVEPSAAVAAELQALMERPAPHGQDWHWGDMQLVRYLFSQPPDPAATQYLWPAVEDGRQGFVPGLRAYAPYASMPGDALRDYVRARAPGHERAEGLLPGVWDGAHPAHIWDTLDVTYDQCVGNCECMPERDSAWCGGPRRRAGTRRCSFQTCYPTSGTLPTSRRPLSEPGPGRCSPPAPAWGGGLVNGCSKVSAWLACRRRCVRYGP
jgi:hypothetical protein